MSEDRAVAVRAPDMPAELAMWWPRRHALPIDAALLVRDAVEGGGSYADLRARRGLLTPEVREIIGRLLMTIERKLAPCATVEQLSDWLAPLNRASHIPVTGEEVAERAAAMLKVLGHIPAVALRPEARRLVRTSYVPSHEDVRQAVAKMVGPWQVRIRALRLLLALPVEALPPPEDTATLRARAEALAKLSPLALGAKAQARVLLAVARQEAPDQVKELGGLLAGFLDGDPARRSGPPPEMEIAGPDDAAAVAAARAVRPPPPRLLAPGTAGREAALVAAMRSTPVHRAARAEREAGGGR